MATHHPEVAEAAMRAARSALRSFHRIPPPVREELVQEAALRTWVTREVRLVEAFATCVARRLALDWLRADRLRRGRPEDTADPSDWQRRTEARLDLDRVKAALARAPRMHRETLEALVLDGRTVDEVLLERGVSPDAWSQERDTLYKRRNRATTWIRTTLVA